MDKDFIDKAFKKNPKAAEATMAVFSVLTQVFDSIEEAVPFMELTSKMLDEPEYIPDKMFIFPGKNPEAEYKLKEVMKVILGRRI